MKTTKSFSNGGEHIETKEREVPAKLPGPEYKMEIVWFNVVLAILAHVAAIIGLLIPKRSWWTIWFTVIYSMIGALGVTAGAHRYFTHKSYKANTKLKNLLVFLQTIAFQNSVYEWSRDHRVHHKYSDTNADPHNASRGFFFSHIGWLLCKKHPDVKKFGAKIDMSDLAADPVIMFQHKYYLPLMITMTGIVPTVIPWFFWGESFIAAAFLSVFRFLYAVHITWLINSAAHMWGTRPFDKGINPTDHKFTGAIGFGEGFHNYHHVFPWDYKTSEHGIYYLNLTKAFIDFFAWIGWATDLKTVSTDWIQKRVTRTGDGTHEYSKEEALTKFVNDRTIDANGNHVYRVEDNIWGWDDKEMKEEDKKYATILRRTIMANN